jgi:hypothetical protein
MRGTAPLGIGPTELAGAPPAGFTITSYREGRDETDWDLRCDMDTTRLVEELARRHHTTPARYLSELITVALRCNAAGRFAD